MSHYFAPLSPFSSPTIKLLLPSFRRNAAIVLPPCLASAKKLIILSVNLCSPVETREGGDHKREKIEAKGVHTRIENMGQLNHEVYKKQYVQKLKIKA